MGVRTGGVKGRIFRVSAQKKKRTIFSRSERLIACSVLLGFEGRGRGDRWVKGLRGNAETRGRGRGMGWYYRPTVAVEFVECAALEGGGVDGRHMSRRTMGAIRKRKLQNVAHQHSERGWNKHVGRPHVSPNFSNFPSCFRG